jgi:hypothetical protein
MLIIRTCLLIFCHFTWCNFEAVYPTVKFSVVNPTRGENPVKSTYACFPPTQPYTKTSADLNVDLPSSGSVKKFTCASFFTDTHARLKTSKMTSRTRSFLYLKPRSSRQWIACSPNLSRHALRQTGHTSSTRNNGINKIMNLKKKN